MNTSFTPRQKENLLKAIELAENPGGCRYSKGCVVAQYFKLEGIDIGPLDKKLELGTVDGCAPVSPYFDTILADYTAEQRRFLNGLQTMWDIAVKNPEDVRRRMREDVGECPCES